jgi:hypothetical protein
MEVRARISLEQYSLENKKQGPDLTGNGRQLNQYMKKTG